MNNKQVLQENEKFLFISSQGLYECLFETIKYKGTKPIFPNKMPEILIQLRIKELHEIKIFGFSFFRKKWNISKTVQNTQLFWLQNNMFHINYNDITQLIHSEIDNYYQNRFLSKVAKIFGKKSREIENSIKFYERVVDYKYLHERVYEEAELNE